MSTFNRRTPLGAALACLALVLVLGSCNVAGEAPETSFSGTYVIMDSASKTVLSTISTDAEGRMTKSLQYDPVGGVGVARSYYYAGDALTRMDEQTALKGSRSVNYSTTETTDAEGRLTEVVTSTSEGGTYSTSIGYGDDGKPMAARVVINGDTTFYKGLQDE